MTDSPLEAAKAAFSAAEAGDWQTLLNLLDPDAIEDFKQRQRRWLAMAEAVELLRKQMQQVFAVNTLGEFDAVPAALILRRWLVVSRARVREARRPEYRRQMLGEVHEGMEFAHIVFRESLPADDEKTDRVRVISARRTARGWRVSLGGGLVTDEGGNVGLGYDPGAADPMQGESDFISSM